ncbi:MAG: MATE family efflux transporter [Gammaproteobacteria bacterium]|nr:MATE family efflux transporter [Gammaproteobacteria bacterium]MYF00618.1 MATE family efflux transporter [Gammaproteobacteria bacterium]MYG95991.1 MATE family efflux transporter [Gammaproteobacteria bacterium]
MAVPEEITHRGLLFRAWPIILANMAPPLLGLADTAIIGNLGDAAALGAIAFGALILSFVYLSFGFLRMGTTGFTARAAGAGDHSEVRAIMGRALLLALVIGLLLLFLQLPLEAIAFYLLEGSPAVENAAQVYFRIRIWGAPAALSVFVLSGILIGLGKGRLLLALQVFLNGLNILLDLLFAGVLGMGVAGIAAGTLIAEWSTFLFGGWLLYRELTVNKAHDEKFWPVARILDSASLRNTVSANTDILLRTLVLVLSFAFFTSQSARFGDVILAANHVLVQFISFAAFFLDGYAFVVESLAGRAHGAGRRDVFDLTVRKSTTISFFTAAALALLLALAGRQVIALLTDIPEVRIAANDMLNFAALYVLLSFAAFQLDGIYIGVSRTRQMRNAAFQSAAVYLLAWWLLTERFGIDGLWWAMIIYVVARAVALLRYLPGLRASFAPPDQSEGIA